jgi:hypothetical protein
MPASPKVRRLWFASDYLGKAHAAKRSLYAGLPKRHAMTFRNDSDVTARHVENATRADNPARP